MSEKYTRNLCPANYGRTDVVICPCSRCFTCPWSLLSKWKVVKHIRPFVSAGVSAVQHPAVPRPKEDHAVDPLDTRQHLWQRRPLRATLPLHLQSSNPRPQPAGSGEAEDRDALLLQRRLHRLLHRWWVQDGDGWASSVCLLSNGLSASPQLACCFPSP